MYEEDEVFEGGVEVGLLLQLDHLWEVLVVDVCVHAEQPLQDRLRHRQEVARERHACGVDNMAGNNHTYRHCVTLSMLCHDQGIIVSLR